MKTSAVKVRLDGELEEQLENAGASHRAHP